MSLVAIGLPFLIARRCFAGKMLEVARHFTGCIVGFDAEGRLRDFRLPRQGDDLFAVDVKKFPGEREGCELS
jgi:hypothetical protein